MVITRPSRITALAWALCCPAFCHTVSDSETQARASNDQSRQDLDHAIRARIEDWYQDNRIDLCRGLAGMRFDIEDEEILLQRKAATVTYTLVQFESCEEGAAYDKVRRTETWIRKAEAWEKVEAGLQGSGADKISLDR